MAYSPDGVTHVSSSRLTPSKVVNAHFSASWWLDCEVGSSRVLSKPLVYVGRTSASWLDCDVINDVFQSLSAVFSKPCVILFLKKDISGSNYPCQISL